MKRKIILNIAPIVFHMVCFVLCMLGKPNMRMNVGFVEGIINTIVIPIYLVVINYARERTVRGNIIKFSMMVIIVLTGIGIIFLGWWLRLEIYDPIPVIIDADTILIIELYIWYGIINLTVSWIIVNIVGAYKTLYQKRQYRTGDGSLSDRTGDGSLS